MDETFCGLTIDTLTQIPTQAFQNQLTALIAKMQSDWDTFFEGIQSQMEGNVATNLQLQINELEQWKSSVAEGLEDIMVEV